MIECKYFVLKNDNGQPKQNNCKQFKAVTEWKLTFSRRKRLLNNCYYEAFKLVGVKNIVHKQNDDERKNRERERIVERIGE